MSSSVTAVVRGGDGRAEGAKRDLFRTKLETGVGCGLRRLTADRPISLHLLKERQ